MRIAQQTPRPSEASPAPGQFPAGFPVPGAPTLDYATLKARLNELGSQLRGAERRREVVAQSIQRTGDPTDRIALQQRQSLIDKQILQLESDIAETGRLVAQSAPPPQTFTGMPPRNNRNDDLPIVVSSLTIMFVLAPLAIALSRRLWKRSSPAPLPAAWNETPSRLERLEQSVDTIALEIERVSESQRFMTRLMTETQLGSAVASVRASADAARDAVAEPMQSPAPKALGAGEKPFEPIKVAERDEVRIRRDG